MAKRMRSSASRSALSASCFAPELALVDRTLHRLPESRQTILQQVVRGAVVEQGNGRRLAMLAEMTMNGTSGARARNTASARDAGKLCVL